MGRKKARAGTLRLDEAECRICGAKMKADDQTMFLHIAQFHPLNLIQHPAIAPRVIEWAFQLGSELGNMIVRAK